MSGAEHEKNAERVIRGLKASIHNPRVSPEAKLHAEERLRELGQVVEPRQSSKSTSAGKRRSGRKVRRASAPSKPAEAEAIPQPGEEARVAIGESKELETEQHQGESRPEPTGSAQPIDKHEARVLGGYKATLHKKGVSEGAKRRAAQVLQEHGAA
ncbi:hypothetical protein F5887DRAFT_13588 [Amanita rubescens]|nr:hypothetical protein F5887DRAFT_13588 [Amanita rubescens]